MKVCSIYFQHLFFKNIGKAKNMDTRTTIYKKTDDFVYSLKMKASREFFSKAVQKFGAMPFTLRAFDDEKKAKMGIIECEKHNLMQPYQVFYFKNILKIKNLNFREIISSVLLPVRFRFYMSVKESSSRNSKPRLLSCPLVC